MGLWKTNLPERGTAASDAAHEAMQLVERWTSGEFKTLVFRNGVGDWCGTIPMSSEDLAVQMAKGREWLTCFAPKTAELRTARRDEWRSVRLAPPSAVEALIDKAPVDFATLLGAFDDSKDRD